MRERAQREVGLFFLLTIALSYLVFWGPLAVFRVQTVNLVSGTRGPLWAILLFILGGFVPSLVGITLTAVFEGKAGVRTLFRDAFRVNIGGKWYAVMLLVALSFGASLVGIYTLLGGKFAYSQFWVQLPTILPLIMLGPLSEELGWRGFAGKRLLKNVDQIPATLAIGLVWAFWHLPLFYLPGTMQAQFHMPFLAFAASVVGTSFAYSYVYLRTNGSLFSAIFLHWLYTYVAQVVGSTVVRSNLYNWLEALPGLLIGLFFAYLLRNEKATVPAAPANGRL